MKKNSPYLIILILLLTACSPGGSGSGNSNGLLSAGPGGKDDNNNTDVVKEWQTASLGQEGHGGDAIVCFNVPIERALYKINTKPENNCPTNGPCKTTNQPVSPNNPTTPSNGIIWRMTDLGRKSIKSAKPLEQYLGERITSKKILIDQLNQISLQQGYEKILSPFTELPSAFSRISEMHRQLGWLHEDGISSEYGLMDLNDSGFVNENEIDTAHCKELQAVVRRDNQLWYDADILKHFDNAGRVLIQLHEELYAWGKLQDKINWEIPGKIAHETSTKTRRLILKLLDQDSNSLILNENLRATGFSTMYWENQFNVPVSIGFHMDTETCVSEQQFLENFLKSISINDSEFLFKVKSLIYSRYLKSSQSEHILQLRNNFPDALSNMIQFTMNSSSSKTFITDIFKLQQIFKQPESCLGNFSI